MQPEHAARACSQRLRLLRLLFAELARDSGKRSAMEWPEEGWATLLRCPAGQRQPMGGGEPDRHRRLISPRPMKALWVVFGLEKSTQA
ncbi:MAG: hypothetical protein ACREPG_10995 [Candidatus Binatia bacterium]